MANREALRELQSRLATRLQAARTEGVRLSWLAVEAAGRHYLFPLHQSGEIFPWESAHPVPYTQPWFLGVANLRGSLFGVIELSGFVDHAVDAVRPVDEARPDHYLVALNAALEVNCALLVERLVGLKSVDSFATSAAPKDADPPYFGNLYSDSNGQGWQEINLQSPSQLPRFLSISA